MKKKLLLATTIFGFLNLTNAQPGQLDPSFGNHGIVTTNLGKDYSYNTAMAIQLLLQSDGSINAIQYQQNYLSKRQSDGARDVTYGMNGYSAEAGFQIAQGALQPDNKVVAVGGTLYKNGQSNETTSDFALVRYNTDGTLDSSFSGDGKQRTNISTSDGKQSDDYANSVVIQRDGKILVMGFSNSTFALARYNTDGSLDSTFDNDGKLYDTSYHIGYGIFALQNDGKIVVGGGISGALRFNGNGSPDPTFVGDTTKAFYSIFSSAVQGDGKIVVAGYLDYSESKIAIGRYNIDGSLDKSFSDDGIQPITFRSQIAVQNNGKILVVSSRSIYQYNSEGNPDKTFGENGRARLSDSVRAFTVATQSNGKIVVGGGRFGDYPTAGYLAIARYNSDGKADKIFDKDGTLIDYFHAGNTVFRRTVAQKDGKILVAGRTWNGSSYDFRIARYNAGGSLDSTFSNHGILMTGITFNFKYYDDADISLTMQNDGKIVAAVNNTLARFNSDGSADKTFSGDGKLVTDSVAHIVSVVIQKDGKIVAADKGSSIRRYNTNGSLDQTFGINGKQTVIIPDDYGNNIYIRFAIIQNDGKIVLTGSAPDLAIVRLNTDGSLDTTFGQGGVTHIDQYPLDYVASVIQNGKIVIASDYFYRERNDLSLFRLNNNGSLDTSFKATTYIYPTGTEPVRNAIALQNDGKIVVSGAALLRFNTDGSLDSTFNINAIQQITFGINDIAISDNKVYAVGGGYYGFVARFLLDGSNTPPTVNLTTPTNNATYLAPAAHIKLSAAASDKDGTITKVEFYNGTTLLHTETVIPYGFVWRNVPLGNYTLTAKAYDNSGNVTTSAPVHISVVPNKAPAVSIIKPSDNEAFAAPAYIHFEAAANDTDGRITRVDFYEGSTLLRTEYKSPYTYIWKNVPRGTYTITAVATDNWGAQTTSEPVTVRVVRPTPAIVSRPSADNKTGLNEMVSLRLAPNPAARYLNVQTSGLQKDKAATISIISASGVVMKTMQINSLSQTQLDVSSLASGVYTIKVISGGNVMYKQFVKL